MAGMFQLSSPKLWYCLNAETSYPNFHHVGNPCSYFLCILSIVIIVILSVLDFFLSKRESFIIFLLREWWKRLGSDIWSAPVHRFCWKMRVSPSSFHHCYRDCTPCHNSAWHHLSAARWCSESSDRCLNTRALLNRGLGCCQEALTIPAPYWTWVLAKTRQTEFGKILEGQEHTPCFQKGFTNTGTEETALSLDQRLQAWIRSHKAALLCV